MSELVLAPTAQARCPKCKQALSGLIVVKGVLQTATGTEIGAAKCGKCDYMIHWGKQKTLTKR
jgi:hypothetical protein